ncbi:MAG: DUF2889 domain-containing protein [Thermodesulfobacteriota bacterium]
MDIFQRSIHSNVKRRGEDHLLVTSSLLDLEHSIHFEMVVRISTATIEAAKGAMSKTPLTLCLRGTEGISELVGLTIGRGVVRQIQGRLGGPRGCAHMVELILDAVRLVSMLLIGDTVNYWSELKEEMTEEEIVARGKEKLKNTCLVFAEP